MTHEDERSRHTTIPIDSLRRITTFIDSDDSNFNNYATSNASSLVSNPALFSRAFLSYSPTIKYTFYSTRTDLRQAWTLEALSEQADVREMFDAASQGSTHECFWLDVTLPTSEDLHRMAQSFGIHPLSTEDIQMKDSREKCEVFELYLFICLRTCDQRFLSSVNTGGDRRMSEASGPATMYLTVFKNFIISVHHEALPHIRRVLRRLYSLRTSSHSTTFLTADWVAYSLLDDAVDEFSPQMSALQLEVDTIDDLVLFLTHTEQSDMLRRIGRARKRVTHLLRLLKPKTDILKTLTRRCPDHLAAHTLIYLRDVNDHVLTALQNLEQYAETLNRSHSNYLAQISIELNEASNRMNVVMKKLTAAAAIVLPLSLISGIWGMNVPVPGQEGVDGLYPLIPFFTIVSAMAIIMLIMYYVGRQHDWW